MITKLVVKDYVARKCPYLVSMELEDKTLINLLKQSIDNQRKYRELVEEEKAEGDFESDGDEGFDLREALKTYPHLKQAIYEYQEQVDRNEVEKLIKEYDNNEYVSELSRKYFQQKYGAEKCFRCDIENGLEILDQAKILEKTKQAILCPDIKVIFEGQVDVGDLRARFDILIKEDGGSFSIVEVKGTKDVFTHPSNDDTLDNRIKDKYLYDLLFQYYVYSKSSLCGNISKLYYLFLNKDYQLGNPSFPVSGAELDNLFVLKGDINLKTGTIPLKRYFDDGTYVFSVRGRTPKKEKIDIEEAIYEIRLIEKNKTLYPNLHYLCRKKPDCEFMKMCFPKSDDPDSILKLTSWGSLGGNYNITKLQIDDLGRESISQISPNPFPEFKDKTTEKFPSVAHLQVEYQKGSIKEKYTISKELIAEILQRDYLNEGIDFLVFFDFESFQYPFPLVQHCNPWQQVVSQYSMHIVKRDYDLAKHDFKSGQGGGITHYEFIGNPDKDRYQNPCIELYKTLKSQLIKSGLDPYTNRYRVVVFNRKFEKGRMDDFVKGFHSICEPDLIRFVETFNSNVVDLLDFFTSGGLYCRDFNGRGSLKVVQPTLSSDKDVLSFYQKILPFDLSDSLEYHNNLVYNGSICLDLYKSLLMRSHLNETNKGPSTDDLLKQALAYCKIDSWGTVIIYDIIKNVYEGKLKLDAKYI